MIFLQLKKITNSDFGEPEYTDIISSRIALNTPFSSLVEAVAEKIGSAPSHARLYIIDELSELTVLKPPSAKATLEETLTQVTLPLNYVTEGLSIACEVTSVPVAELDSMKRIHLGLIADPSNLDQPTEECVVYIGMNDTPQNLLTRLPEPFQSVLKEPIRIIEAHNNRLIRDYFEDDLLASLGETSTVYIEGGVDPLELNPPEGYSIISVFSYSSKDPSRAHSRPFRFLLLPSEPWHLTKQRLLLRLGNPPEAEKWTFSIVSYGRARSINDSDILASVSLGPHDQLGIGRADPNTTPSVGLKSGPISSGVERSIKIRSSAKN